MKYLCSLVMLAECLPAMAMPQTTSQAPFQAVGEHPRPDWARPWLDLNGPWRFAFDPANTGIDARWFDKHDYLQTIIVPYPWQAPLSGIHAPDYQGVAWYERDIPMPAAIAGAPAPRVFIVFGAVDWHATVWVNGKPAGEHEGGYTPFEVELSKFAAPGEIARVTLRVLDTTDAETPTGKQTGWYTPTGGIWQSVYVEYRPQTYLKRAHITPDIDRGEARIACVVDAAVPGHYVLTAKADCRDQHPEVHIEADLKAGENVVEAVMSVPSEPSLAVRADDRGNSRRCPHGVLCASDATTQRSRFYRPNSASLR